jgi:dolichol-phosphate mannosyltransferase
MLLESRMRTNERPVTLFRSSTQVILSIPGLVFLLLLLLQVPATALLLSRLLKGPRRHPPLEPRESMPAMVASVSVVVPTLNEAARIPPLLDGLRRQGEEVREVIVVDSRSRDGTADLVRAAGQQDPRVRVMTDDPLPPGWVGRPWALHSGFLSTSPESEWFLGMDADTQPHPGLVASLVGTAEAEGYDLVSLSPQFVLRYPGECWLQPALLTTLLYRFDPAGVDPDRPERVMANGQCFLCRRSVLTALNGYSSARSSFCDDVTLARKVAEAGYRVGFMDGARVLKVRMYEGALETWKEWGRSLDLKDASDRAHLWGDLWLLASVQGLPVLLLAALLPFWSSLGLVGFLLLGLNLFLLLVRFALLLAIAPSYDRSAAKGGWLFWLSPLADPLAVLRIFLSALRTPREWRGRTYDLVGASRL